MTVCNYCYECYSVVLLTGVGQLMIVVCVVGMVRVSERERTVLRLLTQPHLTTKDGCLNNTLWDGDSLGLGHNNGREGVARQTDRCNSTLATFVINY